MVDQGHLCPGFICAWQQDPKPGEQGLAGGVQGLAYFQIVQHSTGGLSHLPQAPHAGSTLCGK